MTVINNFNDYQILAEKTSGAKGLHYSGTDKTGAQRLLVAALGLVGEVIELYMLKNDFDKIRESGDVAWYIAEACSTMDLEMEHLPINKDPEASPLPIVELLANAGKFSEHVKKVVAHDHPYDETVMRYLLGRVLSSWLEYCDEKNLNYIEVLMANINKLKKRYGEKFSSEASQARIDKLLDENEGILRRLADS